MDVRIFSFILVGFVMDVETEESLCTCFHVQFAQEACICYEEVHRMSQRMRAAFELERFQGRRTRRYVFSSCRNKDGKAGLFLFACLEVFHLNSVFPKQPLNANPDTSYRYPLAGNKRDRLNLYPRKRLEIGSLIAHFKSLGDFHIQVVRFSVWLSVGKNIIDLLGMPTLDYRHDQYQPNSRPRCHRGICFPIIESLDLL
jgi:hypothetical protein